MPVIHFKLNKLSILQLECRQFLSLFFSYIYIFVAKQTSQHDICFLKFLNILAVSDPCHIRGPQKPCQLTSEDHAELISLSLALGKLTLPLFVHCSKTVDHEPHETSWSLHSGQRAPPNITGRTDLDTMGIGS